jgi:hypothetical protein
MSGWHKPRGKEIEKIYRNRPRRHGKKAKQQSQNAGEDTEDTIVQRQAGEAYKIRQEFVKEFKESKHSHRAIITAASCYIEWMVNYIVRKRCKTGKEIVKKQHISLSSKVVLLYELEIINKDLYCDVMKLNSLRNDAVHEVKFKLQKSDIAKFDCFKKAEKNTQENLKKKKNPMVDIVEHILLQLEEKYINYVRSATEASST